jgi:hypothetical protein
MRGRISTFRCWVATQVNLTFGKPAASRRVPRLRPAQPERHFSGTAPCTITLAANAYSTQSGSYVLQARSEQTVRLQMKSSGYRYDFSAKVAGQPDFSRRFAARIETGLASFTDPAMFVAPLGTNCAWAKAGALGLSGSVNAE